MRFFTELKGKSIVTAFSADVKKFLHQLSNLVILDVEDPVSQLFDIEAGVFYTVPRYQREYTRGKNQWENLFEDVLENDPGYFLGSIICINQSTDALSVQKLELVDGQQRLTTLSLLFASVYHSLPYG